MRQSRNLPKSLELKSGFLRNVQIEKSLFLLNISFLMLYFVSHPFGP